MKLNRTLISISALGLGSFAFACSDDVTDDTATGGTAGVATGGVDGMLPGSGGVDGMPPGGVGGTGVGGVIGTAPIGGDTGAGGVVSVGVGGSGTGNEPGVGGAGNSPGVGGSDVGVGGGDTGVGGAMLPDFSLITSGESAPFTEGVVADSTGAATVTVNLADEKQAWTGWGGTFNEKGWDALKVLSEADRLMAIRLLFSPTEGAGFTYGRIPVGSSDYGLDRYSLNETADDFAMANFSIDRDKQDLIPYIKAAMVENPNINFWASPWSPPTWMKDNNAFDKGNMKDDDATLGAHALYLAKFVQAYAAEGITISAVHPQNEPGFPQDYPSCTWTGATMAKYIGQHMGPVFEAEGITAEIWLGTMSNTSSDSIVTAVMGDATARGYVKGIGAQWGMKQNIGGYVSTYGLPAMQTEHQCGNNPWESSYQAVAPNDFAYADEGWTWIKEWLEGGVNSYLAWNMVLDTNGRSLDEIRAWSQNAPLIVDRNSMSLILTPTYYMFRHLAQYVKPGAVRLGTTGGNVLAFKNSDGRVVTIFHNNQAGAAQEVLTVGDRTVQVEVPGRGWATVNLQMN